MFCEYDICVCTSCPWHTEWLYNNNSICNSKIYGWIFLNIRRNRTEDKINNGLYLTGGLDLWICFDFLLTIMQRRLLCELTAVRNSATTGHVLKWYNPLQKIPFNWRHQRHGQHLKEALNLLSAFQFMTMVVYNAITSQMLLNCLNDWLSKA